MDNAPLNKHHAILNGGRKSQFDTISFISSLCLSLGGRIESTFVRTSRADNSSVDTSTIVQLKKAHTTCDAETGEVEIEWPENLTLCEGILGKEVFASGATKNVYKVFSTFPLRLLV